MSPLKNITPELIKQYQNDIQTQHSDASAKRKVSSLNKFLSWAEEKGYVAEFDKSEPIQATDSFEQVQVDFPHLSSDVNFVPESQPIQTPVQNFNTQVQSPIEANPTPIPAPTTFKAVSTSNNSWFKTGALFLGGIVVLLLSGIAINTFVFGGRSPSIAWGDLINNSRSNGSEQNQTGTIGGGGNPTPTPQAASIDPSNQETEVSDVLSARIINLLSTAPVIEALEGLVLMTGEGLTFKTNPKSDGDITVNPDGEGQFLIRSSTTTESSVDIKNANLTTGALISGTVGHDGTDYDLLRLSSGSTERERFVVDAQGNTSIAGSVTSASVYTGTVNTNNLSVAQDIDLEGDLKIGGVTRFNSAGRLASITGYYQDSGLFEIDQGSADYATIDKTPTAAQGPSLADSVTFTVDESNTTNSAFDTLVLNRVGGTEDAYALDIRSGNLHVAGDSTFEGDITVEGTINGVDFAGGGTVTFANLTVTNNTNLQGNVFDSTGDLTLNDDVDITGTLDVTGAAAFASTIQVQSASTLFSGTGVPSNAIGSNGDYYYRTDGTTGNTSIYYKTGGAWISAGGGSLQDAYNVGASITTTSAIGNIAITLASGLAHSQTLTNAGTATAFVINDTSASTNTSLDIQKAGVSKFSVTEDGNVTVEGSFTANGAVSLGDGNDTVTINGTTFTATASPVTFNISDNITDAWDLQQGTDNYVNVNTTDGSENVSIGNATTNPSFNFLGSGVLAIAGNTTVGGGYGDTGVTITSAGAISADGALTLSGTNLDINSLDFVGAGTITAASGNALNINTTSANITLATTTTGDITATTGAATGLVNVLTGNLKVGDGTPDVTLNGEDLYVEGTLEVDGNARFDGTTTFAAADFTSLTVGGGYGDTGVTISSTGNISANGNLIVDGTADITGIATFVANVNANGGLDVDDVFVIADGGILTTTANANFNAGLDIDDVFVVADGGILTTTANANFNAGFDVDDAFVVADGGVLTTSQTANFDGTADFDGDVLISDTNIAFDGASTTFTTTGAFTLTPGGAVILGDGGDALTLSSTTLDIVTTGNINFADDATTKTMDIGGVTNSGTDTINISTNGTAADIITIGNSNASTTMALTGGDDWSIDAAGDASFEDLTLTGTTITASSLATFTTSATLALSGTTTLNTSLTSQTVGAGFYIDGTTYVGIGNGTPGSASGDDDLYVEGDLEIDGVAYFDGTIDTTFTAGSVVFAGTNGVLSQDNASFFWDDSSNELGIGTTTPGAKLVVWDSTDVTSSGAGALNIGASATELIAIDNNEIQAISGGAAGTLFLNADGGTVSIHSGTDGIFQVNTNDLYVTAAGSVGIGTSTPGAKLDILHGTASGTALRLGDVSTDTTTKQGRVAVRHYTNSEEDTALLFSNNSVGTNAISVGGGSSLYNAATQIDFYTAANTTTTTGTQRMVINSSGQVTIAGSAEGTASLIQTAGDHTITDGDLTLSSGEISATSDDATGTNFNFVTGTLTSGTGLGVSTTGSASTAFTGDIVSGSFAQTWTAASSPTNTGNILDLSRALTINAAGQTLTQTGSLAKLSSSGVETAGNIADSSNILLLEQNCGTGVTCSGAVLKITNAGTGKDIALDNNETIDNATDGQINFGADKLDLDTTATAGTLFNISYDASMTQSAALTGLSVNLFTNVSNTNINQTALELGTRDGGVSGTSIGLGFVASSTVDRGIDFSNVNVESGGSIIYNDASSTIDLAAVADNTLTVTNSSGNNTNDNIITLAVDANTDASDKILLRIISNVGGTDTSVFTVDSDGDIIANSINATQNDCDNCLDFDDFLDTMALDANLTINQGTNTWTQNYTDTTGTAFTYNANSLTTGTVMQINSSNGLSAGGELLDLVGNAIQTGNLITASATALTTGSFINFTGPSGATAGVTGEVFELTSDVGNAGSIIESTATFDSTSAAATSYNTYLSSTNSNTTNANTTYGLYSTLSDAIALNNTNYGGYFNVANTGANTGGTKSMYGIAASASSTSSGSAARTYGGHFTATSDTSSDSIAYGLYTTASGGDTNYGIYSAAGSAAFAFAAGESFAIDAATADNTTTGGVFDLNVDSITTGNIGLNVDYNLRDSGGITAYGSKLVGTLDSDAGHDSTLYGLHITVDNDDAGSTVYGLLVDADGDGSGTGTEYAAAFLDGNVGVGVTTPETDLHVFAGESGTAARSDSPITIESDVAAYLSFITPNTIRPGIIFGDPQDTDEALFAYSHSNDEFYFSIDSTATELLTMSGTDTFFNEGGADINFRIESAVNSNAFVMDAGLGTVTIGSTGTSTRHLEVVQASGNDTNFVISQSAVSSWFFTNRATSGELAIGLNATDDKLTLSSTASVFNDDSADIDFRVESNNNANMFNIDAGEDAVWIGSAAATTFNSYFTVDGHARTADANEVFYRSYIRNSNAITTAASGTHTTISGLTIAEPNITIGTAGVTNSASLYIIEAATEATNNYALWVDAGATRLDGDLVVGGSTSSTETLAHSSFVMGGDDLFVAGTAGIEGTIFTDSGINIANNAFSVASTGLSGIAPTTTGTILDIALETEWTTGTVINADYASSTTQTGDISGVVMDFQTNLTGAADSDVTGFRVNTPALTSTGTATTTYTGFSLPTAGSLVQNTAAGTIAWRGGVIQMPAITQTTGTVTARGLVVANSTITTGGTQTMIDLSASGVGAGTLYGINIGAITGAGGNEYAIQIGSGWDTSLLFNDTTTNIMIADGGTFTFEDANGNDLMTLADSSNLGNMALTGDLAVNGDDITSDGDLTINPAGGQLYLADTRTINIGGLTNVAYNAFANSFGESPEEAAISSDNDLYIGGDLEIDGTLYAGDISCVDCLDFVDFEDTLDLDADLVINQGTNTWTQNFTGTTTTGFSYVGNSLTTGTLLSLTSTSITSGKFLDINNGSSIFSVSNTDFTTSLPTSFTATGDVTIAYDLLFSNQTASFIKTNAPFTIEVGESFESNDLTFKTYNQGSVVFDSSVTTGTAINIPNTTVTTGDLIDITATALTSGYILDVTVPATRTSGGLRITDSSTSTASDGLIQIDVAGTTDQATIDIDTSGVFTGNIIDVAVGANAATGEIINVNLGATAVNSSGLVITSGSSVRTAPLILLTDANTTGSVNTLDIDANTSTTTDVVSIAANGLTTGTGLNISSTSTAGGGSGSSYLLKLARSGTNSNATHTAYGISSSVTNTGTTSTNIGGYFTTTGATTNKGLVVTDMTGATNYGLQVGALSGATANNGIAVGATSGGGTGVGLAIGAFSNTGATAHGITVGAISGANATEHGTFAGSNISGTTPTAFGLYLGTLTGGTSTNYQITTGAITAVASATNAHINLGTISGTAASSTNYGINLGAISSTGTINTGVNVGAVTGATTNYGVYIANGSTYSIFADAGDARFDEDVIVGGSTSSTETISAAGFSLGGDDLFVAGLAGVEGTIYTDAGLDVNNSTLTIASTGNITTAGDLALNGDDLTSDGALTINSASYVRIGDTATPNVASGDDDLFVEGDLEIDGTFTFGSYGAIGTTPVNNVGVYNASTSTADANGEVLLAYDGNPTFATGTFTGLTAANIFLTTMSKTGTGTIDTASQLHISNAPTIGTTNYAIFVDAGNSRFDGNINVTSGGITIDAGNLAVNSDTITSDSNLTIAATGYVRVGDSGTPGSATGDDDLYVESDIEVDGNLYVDGTSISAPNVTAFACNDCIDFEDMENSLNIDEATDINLGAFALTIDMDSTGDFSIRDGTTDIATFSDNGTIAFTPTSGTNFSVTAAGAGAINHTTATGSQTFTSSVVTGTTTTSGFVFDATAITSGTGMYLTSDSITTGKMFDLATTGNTFTTGTLLNIASTSTALTSGKFLNISNGSDIFTVSNTAFSTSLPTEFSSAGDVSIAYDLIFTNPTASYVKSAAPLYIVAGETFNSSNLTFQTYNEGTFVFESAVTTGTGISIPNTTVTTGDLIDITASALTTGYILDVTVPATRTSGGIRITDNSTSTSSDGLVQLDVAGATDTNIIDVDTSAAWTGNIIDVAVGAQAATGNVFKAALGSTATTARGILIDADGAMANNGWALAIDASGAFTESVIDFDNTGNAAWTGHIIDIDTGTGSYTGNIIDVLMEDGAANDSQFIVLSNQDQSDNAGWFTNITASATFTGSMFAFDHTGNSAWTGDLFNITTGTGDVSGDIIDITFEAGATDVQAIVVNNAAATDQAGWLMDVDTSGIWTANAIDFDIGAQAATGDVINISMGSTAVAAGAFVIADAGGARTDALIDITSASTASTEAGSIIQIAASGAFTSAANVLDINTTAAFSGNVIDITTATAASSGNLIDLNFGNVADTGDAINVSMGAAAVAAQAMVVSTTAGIRTQSAFAITENNTSGTVATFDINGASTRGGLFDIDWTGVLVTENLIDITYSTGAATSNTLDLNMGTNVAGNALDIATAATTGNAIDITTSGVFTNDLIDINVGAQAATGTVLNIAMGTTAVGAQAFVLTGTTTGTDGAVSLSVDTAAAGSLDVVEVNSTLAAMNGSDVYQAFDVNITNSGNHTTGSNTITGIDLNISAADAEATETALNISANWDTDINAATQLELGIGGTNEVAINSSALYAYTTDGSALGTSTNMWSDLFLASGGVINWDNNNVNLTHSTGVLSLTGQFDVASGGIISDARIKIEGTGATCSTTEDDNSAGIWYSDAGDCTTVFAGINSATNGSESWGVYIGGWEVVTTSTSFSPGVTDGSALGTSSLMWSDLFLASGAVTNWNNGDVLLTHSADRLQFTGGTSYEFDAVIRPVSNDGASLGSSGVAWSDLFLASGAVVNFAAGDVTLTHSSNALAFAGASSGYSFDAAITVGGASSLISNSSGDITINSASNNISFSSDNIINIGNLGIGDASPDVPLDIESSATTTDVMMITASSLTTGTALTITGPTATGVTDHLVKIAGDVGLNTDLVNLAPDFTNDGQGLRILGTNSTASGNTNYNIFSSLALTGDAAKTGYGVFGRVTSTSTIADTTFGGYFDNQITGIITSGNRYVAGAKFVPNAGAESTGGTTEVYGVLIDVIADVGVGGILNAYGVYVANTTSDGEGTTNKYGIYIADQSGMDNNYGIIVAGEDNVGFGTATPATSLHVYKTTGTAEVRIQSDNDAAGIPELSFWNNTIRKWSFSNDPTSDSLHIVDQNDIQANFRNDATAQNDDGWATAAIDYGEFMKKQNTAEDIKPFEVVGIKNGLVTKDTSNSSLYMVTSSDAGIRGGNPLEAARDNDPGWIVVAFTGQVPILVNTEAQDGDYVIPSGNNDGKAVAVSPNKITSEQYKKIIGVILNEFDISILGSDDGGFEKDARDLLDRKGSYKVANVAIGTRSGFALSVGNRIEVDENGNVVIKNFDGEEILAIDSEGNTTTQSITANIATFVDAYIENLTAGLINVTVLVAQSIEAAEITTGTLIADNITLNDKLISPIIEVGTLTASEKLISPLVETGVLTANDATISGTLIAQDVDTTSLTSESLEVSNDATISGTLYADRVVAREIEGLSGVFEEVIASRSATQELAFERAVSSNQSIVDAIRDRISNIESSLNTFTDANQDRAQLQQMLEETATSSASIAFESSQWTAEVDEESSVNLTGGLNILADLNVYGTTRLSDTFINDGTLAIADTAANTTLSLSSSAITAIGGALELLATDGINFQNGALYIASGGEVYITQNLFLSGNLATNTISPNGDDLTLNLANPSSSSFGDLLIAGADGQTVASIDASGSATVNKLIIASSLEASPSAIIPGEITSNATAGEATLEAGETELIIRNPNVTENTLVYLTLASPTTKVLYVKNKLAGDYFTVAVDSTSLTDIKFNWWIIDLRASQ